MTLKLPLSLLAAALLVSGCVTSSPGPNWGEWKDIDPSNSTVAVALPADAEVTVKRRKDVHKGTLEEIWEWQTGVLQIVKFPQNAYSRQNYRTVADLTWQLSDQELVVTEDQANYGINRLGNFIYGIVESDQKSCLVYSQGYPLSGVPAGYDSPTEGSRGFIRGIDCRNGNPEELTAQFLPIIDSMRVQ